MQRHRSCFNGQRYVPGPFLGVLFLFLLLQGGCRPDLCTQQAPAFEVTVRLGAGVQAAAIDSLKITIHALEHTKQKNLQIKDQLDDGETSFVIDVGPAGINGYLVTLFVDALDSGPKKIAGASQSFPATGDACNFFELVLTPVGAVKDGGLDSGVPDVSVDSSPDAPGDSAIPDLALPDQAIPDLVMSDQAIPDLPPPDQAIPDLPPPDQAIPDLSLPDQTVPDTAPPCGTGKVCTTGPMKWCWENPLPQGNTLRSLWGTGPSDVFAVGDNGTVLRYDGKTWKAKIIPPEALNAVAGSSATNVYAVGYNGRIRRFDGTTWTTISSPVTYSLNGVWVASSGEVIAAGNAGYVARFDGSKWHKERPTIQNLYGVWGGGPTDVFVVGDEIWRHNGTSWSPMTMSPAVILRSVWGVAGQEVMAVGSGANAMHYAYKGTQWAGKSKTTPTNMYALWGSALTNVFAVGYGHSGQMIRNYGTVWSVYTPPSIYSPQRNYLGLWGSSASDIFAVGRGGFVFHYDGTSWTYQTSEPKDNLRRMWGSSPTNIYAVGGSWGAGLMMHWDGVKWSDITPAGAKGSTLNDIWGAGPTDIYVVGKGGLILHHTGSGWPAMSVPPAVTSTELWGVWGSSPSQVMVVGAYSTVLHLAKGGTWTKDATVGFKKDAGVGFNRILKAVWGSSATDVFVVGNDGILLHHDGVAWTDMSDPKLTTKHLYDVWGTSSTNVYAVGASSTLLKYSGTKWIPEPFTYGGWIMGIWGSGPSDIYAVGQKQNILHFNGTSWSAVDSGCTNGLNGVWGTSKSNVYLVGGHGTILHRCP